MHLYLEPKPLSRSRFLLFVTCRRHSHHLCSPSLSLSGNKNNPALNSEGKPSKDHVMVYNAEDVANHPQIGLTRGGLILFALLSGGDYDTVSDWFPNIRIIATQEKFRVSKAVDLNLHTLWQGVGMVTNSCQRSNAGLGMTSECF